jgi:uncharacterized membrane protein YfcA
MQHAGQRVQQPSTLQETGLDPSGWILVVIILVAAATLQSAAGFGFGLLAIPLLMILGFASYEAIVICSVCVLLHAVVGGLHLRKHVNWPQVLGLVALAAVATPVGVWVLGRLDAVGPTVIRQVFGGIVLLALLVQYIGRVQPTDRVPVYAGVIAMLACGFMAGLSGMGGPPAVIWVMAHKWSSQRSRATLWLLFAGLTPFQAAFLYQSFGSDVLEAAGIGALLSPVIVLGMIPGLWIGHHMSKALLRRLSYAILVLIAGYAILQPAVSGLLSGGGGSGP